MSTFAGPAGEMAKVSSILLTLADGRFPAGSYAHSGGLEEAVARGRIVTEKDLGAFLVGRLHTAGRVDACFSAFSWFVATSSSCLVAAQAEAAARLPSAAQRDASASQGRGLLRAAKKAWPEADLDAISAAAAQRPQGPMYSVVLGAVGHGLELGVAEVALVAAQGSVTGAAWASTRLLGLDPFAVVRCLSSMAPAIEETATSAVADAADAFGRGRTAAELPAHAAPLLEIGAESHATWEVRLFAS
jgi:urease accessory protein